MPPAQTIDGVPAAMLPVHTIFVTARLARAPSTADQTRMENALRTIEANYPYAPNGVFTHVAYSVDYFNLLPSSVVNSAMPLSISFGGLLACAQARGAWSERCVPGNQMLDLRRPEFNVQVRPESNDMHRSGRMPDGRPIHLRIDGPGIDTKDTTTGRYTPKLQFSGCFPTSDFFALLRGNQASVDLLNEFDLELEDHGIERFITATRRQNFLIPPRLPIDRVHLPIPLSVVPHSPTELDTSHDSR